MSAKRALVVDDSKSARAFLTRMLEDHALSVDSVESAEQAIEYLAHRRPDVIFMDHLMPGMDGFQAVHAIKNNPRTATIPIMMYTSQEGELYLSQARALGALGVLPKQIRPADLSKALEQLKLLGDESLHGAAAAVATAASSGAAGASAAGASAPAAPSAGAPPERRAPGRPNAPALSPELRSIVEAMLQHHAAELRRFTSESLETHADRIIGDVRLLLHDNAAAMARSASPPRSGSRLAGFGWVALVAAIVLGLQWWHEYDSAAALSAQLAQTRQQLNAARSSLQSLQLAAAAAAAAAAAKAPAAAAASADASNPGAAASSAGTAGAPVSSGAAAGGGTSAGAGTGGAGGTAQGAAAGTGTAVAPMIEPVPYGQMPLAGSRVPQIQALLTQLDGAGFEGAVLIRSVPGRFCLAMGPAGALVLAPKDTLYSQCAEVSTGAEQGSSPSDLQSVGFANMLAAARAAAQGRFDIEVSAGTADDTLAPYPPVTDTLTAGQWNRAAIENNRIEVRLEPSH